MRQRIGTAVLALLAASQSAAESSWVDWIRNYDLNDYALGASVSVRQSPYIGGENSLIAYPYLTSFTHSSFTRDWFLIRDGGYGIRWVGDNEWEFGLIGRVSTLSLGNSDAEEIIGIEDRKWALEVGPTVGYRDWPVHINWTHWADISNRHGGYQSVFAFSYPIQFDRGFLIPRIDAIYDSGERNDYYYSVRSFEAGPGRPEYKAGSSWSTAAEFRIGYELNPSWLLSATVGIEWLASEVTDSPIVARDRILFGNVGLAYNADIFNPTAFENYNRQLPAIDLRVSAFFAKINSTLTRDTSDGVPGFEIDLEDILGASNDETAIEADAIFRIGEHHALELGYFELVRDSSVTLQDDLVYGDEFFPQGTVIDSRVDYSSLRFGYTFYLMRDNQKELGVMGGVHLTQLSANINADGTPQVERSKSSAPLPVIGLNGAVFLGDKTTLRARIHIFRTDFDNYEGSLNYAALDLERKFGDLFRAGIGYKFYGAKLTSNDDSLNGDLNIRHHGPVLFVTVGF